MKVTIGELVEAMDHIQVVSGDNFLDREIIVSDLSRPGLELAGYFRFYPEERLQLFGQTEISFINEMPKKDRLDVLDPLCTPMTPGFLVSRNLEIPSELYDVAQKHNIPIIRSNRSTTRLASSVTSFLEERLSERQSQHGVLVDVYGMGVLIIGASGIGKSEIALELIERGHRLVADDRVDLYMVDESRIIGEAPEILRHLIEIRGVGIINVVNLFGVGSIRESKVVDFIIELEQYDPTVVYDRLGHTIESMKFFNVELPKLSIPVKVGRNVSIIVEMAAMNLRAKQMGYDATIDFEKKLAHLIEKNKKDD
ncbi:HPr(Ser) kinase/phosphatase [Allofustis seminis]|uniref:HPr(Ser) kinase/phosphatase n=1 Tax=Allofustis seminis TaxID=166939 RepID=UPI0003747C59|nr:HPr(Ser) kinase/phosphatase [Allofustis seminis]